MDFAEHQLVTLASIGIVSLVCQWVAWRMRLPAILFLLIAGLFLGPYAGWIDPNELLGDLFFPIVSLAVAIILFEGSLTLKFTELKEHGKMVRNLLSVGTLVTWLVATLVCLAATEFSWGLSLLFGAIVVVSGPTVVMPLLRSVKPNQNVSNILKWEGIIIDPIGALLAVLVYEFMISTQGQGSAIGNSFLLFGETIVLGVGLGCAAGFWLGQALRKHWLPQFLANAGTLTFVLGMFALSNFLVEESGLLTVTVMGLWMANMKGVPVDDILEFKESLSVLLISALFILLAARMDVAQLQELGMNAVWVLLVLILVARPMAVFASALGTQLTLKEKLFLSWIAPRGIVAAAVSSLFAFKLEQQGFANASLLVSLVFSVIVVTVILQSLTAAPLAKWLQVNEARQDGYLFIGANAVARQIASALVSKGVRVVLSDTSWENVRAARMDNLPVYFGNPVSEHAENNLDLTGVGNMAALSPYKQLNTQATYHYLDLMGPGHVFGVPEGDQGQRASHQSSGQLTQTRKLFGSASFAKLASLVSKGASVKVTPLTSAFGFEAYCEQNAGRLTPLFAIAPDGRAIPYVDDFEELPTEGWSIIGLIQAPSAEDSSQDQLSP